MDYLDNIESLKAARRRRVAEEISDSLASKGPLPGQLTGRGLSTPFSNSSRPTRDDDRGYVDIAWCEYKTE